MAVNQISFVRGMVASVMLGINTCFWCVLLFCVSLIKFAIPTKPVRAVADRTLNAIAHQWIACNSGWMRLTPRTEWDVSGLDELGFQGWYMVCCNHQSWADIFVLQHLLNRRIPLLKFVLKQQLIYVPVIGLAWWALDFPFMRRHSSAYLQRHPEKRLEDLEATRKACEKFALVPTSVMNFVEGTRFTPEKHRAQQSPYQFLLKPKAGALAQALDVLGDRFRWFLDFTIVYPNGAPSFWEFLCGRVPEIVVRMRRLPIPPEFGARESVSDLDFRKSVEHWLQEVWRDKDQQIAELVRRNNQ